MNFEELTKKVEERSKLCTLQSKLIHNDWQIGVGYQSLCSCFWELPHELRTQLKDQVLKYLKTEIKNLGEEIEGLWEEQ